MATSVYKFLSWANASHSGGDFGAYYGTIQVHWNYEKSNKKINITGITYNDDCWWAVGAKMRMSIVWADGVEETVCADQNYNWNGSGLISTARGAGFVTTAGILGVFSNFHAVSHTFSGTTGGFGVRFGSTLGTINLGNPASYRDLDKISGDDTNVTFSTPPNLDSATITTSNPSLYKLTSSISGIKWGEGWSSRSLVATVRYTIDGNTVEYTAYNSNNPPANPSFTIDAIGDTIPWNRVPDGETVRVRWIATTDIGSVYKDKEQFCMKQYDAFVIQSGVNNGNPVAADLIVSNTIGSQPNKEVRRVTTIE